MLLLFSKNKQKVFKNLFYYKEMNLQDYLLALKNSNDEKLSRDFGVGDNYTIILNVSEIEKIREFFCFSLDYKFDRIDRIDNLRTSEKFDYLPGTVKIQVLNYPWEDQRTEILKINGKYNSTILIHPYQTKKVSGMSDIQAIAQVICKISEELIEPMGIPACFLDSAGKGKQNLSNVVFFK